MKKYGIFTFFLVALVAALAALAGWYFYSPHQPAPKSALGLSTNPADIRAYWSSEIARIGLRPAYTEFADFYSGTSTIEHTAGHIMGDLLYTNLGVQGIAVCTDVYGFACYHGFFARAVSDQGLSIIPAMQKTCASTLGSADEQDQFCFHGIGHGILDYFGDTELPKALAECKKNDIASSSVVWLRPCLRGAFMEYTTPFITATSTPYFGFKVVDPNNVFAPCPSPTIADEFKGACYFILPHLWLHQRNPISVAEVGKRCNEVPDKYKQECYYGLSIDLPTMSNFDQQKVLAACKLMPTADGVLWCLQYNVRELSLVYHLDACEIEKYIGQADSKCSN